ncbi:unnamed protein product [Rangifer tarandus platyrhynchus]|uniref:Uncharacterized protein n=2 Tax=Rangifer tarandus platyrhynchus TaxID=3082113 RepID=A0AC59YLT1_RANTA|nr:unnamed protein product [Rangifer tarandus platyrhynchus]
MVSEPLPEWPYPEGLLGVPSESQVSLAQGLPRCLMNGFSYTLTIVQGASVCRVHHAQAAQEDIWMYQLGKLLLHTSFLGAECWALKRTRQINLFSHSVCRL